jgi:diadenosine tetraphosphate (Ap4A) HIT family hydrolase
VSAEANLAVAFADAFPVSHGHTLVVPRRHEPNLFALTAEEHCDVWRLVREMRASIDGDSAPDGYNLGVNIGAAGGQTVAHAHVHLIPRYRGDASDPRGGIRWVLPEHARYWDDNDN